MREVNRAELARLILEHLADKGLGKEEFARSFPDTVKRRAVYHWMAGSHAPVGVGQRAVLEDVLGWKRGSVATVLDSKPGSEFVLSELRDWTQVGESEKPVARASELSLDELVLELTRRVGVLQARNELLEQNAADRSEPKGVFGLAANSMDAGRNMEHLEP
ncbi:hypothetical protein [Paenarthrobacter sp. CAP02]|uniref:hypothetical protein n=1 Tax=Paenarthrobacter sp. CAP02 TaxID=3158144 RepID=UPI0032DB4822